MVAAIFTMKKDWPVIESVSIKKNEDRNPGLNLDLSYDNLSPLPRASDISRGRGAAKFTKHEKDRQIRRKSYQIHACTTYLKHRGY